MKTQIVLFALLCGLASARIRLTATTSCACSEITQQADCTGQCTWANSACSAKECSSYTTQDDCDATACAWTNDGACKAFTACADYTVTNPLYCYSKDKTCIPGTTSGTSTTCKTGPTDCTTITDQASCLGFYAGGTSICGWTTKCVSVDVSKCSTITVQQICQDQDCNWTNNACVAPKCADQAQAQCTAINADTQGQYQICNWANNACADAADASALTVSNCKTSTSGTYKWNGSSCVACTGSSSNAFLLAFFALLSVLLF